MSEQYEEEWTSPRAHRKTRMPDWNINHLGAILGCSGVAVGRYLAGMHYPTVDMMKKIEVIFGWPAREQIDLIKPVWEGKDMRYAMVLKQVIDDWKLHNPRTTPASKLVSRFPSRYEDPFGNRAKSAARKASQEGVTKITSEKE